MRKEIRALGGGMMKKQDPQQPIINYIDVKPVDEYFSKVQQLGDKYTYLKWQFPEWAILQFVLIQK
jgi:predicted enzyme related to lactoylglutathione lyase